MSRSAITPRPMKRRQRQRIAALGLGPGIVVGSLRNGREPYAAVVDDADRVLGAIIAPTFPAKPEVVESLESLVARGAGLWAVGEALERVASDSEAEDVLAKIGAEVERSDLLAREEPFHWLGDWWFPGSRETAGFDAPISRSAPCAIGHFDVDPDREQPLHLVTVYGEGRERIAPWIGMRKLMEAYEAVYLLRVGLDRGDDPPRVAAALTMAAALPDSLSALQRELERSQP